MTGYTVHTGSSEKFSSGWDQIFSGNKSAKKKVVKADEAAAPIKAAEKKPAKPATKSKKKSK